MTDDDRLTTPDKRPEDIDAALRPKTLAEFIGQAAARDNLRVFIEAAKGRGQPLDHVLFFGPPGLGKTTLAQIVAKEMGVGFRATSGPVIAKSGDLAALLTNLEDGDVLFIDEIHRLSPVVEEILYPAMEDCKVDIMIGKGPAARSIRLDVPKFTVVGATTRQGLLTGPLRDRFGIISHFQFYDRAALYEIVVRSAHILGFPIDKTGAEEIARRSRGTPRIANRLLRRVRDFAQVDGYDTIDNVIAAKACHALEIDDNGLDQIDRQLLRMMIERYRGGPVGLDTLAASTGEDATTIEDVYEPYLLQMGYIQRTPRGRMVTDAAYKLLGLAKPSETPLLES